MSVSVICTVLNEAAALPRLLDALAAQTRPPDDVVICDGGSSDGTRDLLYAEAARGRMPLRVLERPGANISQGRNAAIAAARGEWIAVTDAGVWLEPQWLAEIVAPLERGAAAAAGFFVPEAHTPFERAMAATVLPAPADIDPRHFLPSSRSVAFRKDVWAAAGGYPEWLDFCEDLIFDFRVQALAGGFAFAPDARAHFRPRGTLGAFFRQYYQYARGDGKADLWRKRHAVRYATYLIAVPLIAWLGAAYGAAWWLLFVPGAVLYLGTPYRRLAAAGWLTAETALWVPVIRVWGDVAKMLGYPAGWWWRLRMRPPDWHVMTPDTPAHLVVR